MTVSVLLAGVAALAILLLIGFFAISLLWPPDLRPALRWAFAPAVGGGICSIIFIFFRRPMFTIELVLLLALAVAWYARRSPPAIRSHGSAVQIAAVWLLLAAALGIAASQCLVIVERAPHGDYDATGIWNSHARYLYRDGPGWRFHIQNTAHPDYPLLVPSLVARLWRYIGSDIPDAASVSAALFMFGGIAVLAAVLAELSSATIAVLIAVVLVGTPFYLSYGVAQSADVPLSFYILSTLALLCLQRSRAPDSRGLLALAGFTAACAGWIKNEGLLFLVAVTSAILLPIWREPRATLRRFAMFTAGALLPLLTIVWFKIAVAPPNGIAGNRQVSEIAAKISDGARHAAILHQFAHTFWTFGDWLVSPAVGLLVFIAVWGIARERIRNVGWLQSMFVCAMVAVGYYAVYLVTPYELQWHLESSLPRLYLHLWPASLLLAGLAVRDRTIVFPTSSAARTVNRSP
jgi:hypothetical protein